ncbi:MAG: hypothetical protein NT007_09745 [Candidatus Kapabacteria bacterium]|nr:hypothetical protein [Candidatus Kapabacteria bacterium]
MKNYKTTVNGIDLDITIRDDDKMEIYIVTNLVDFNIDEFDKLWTDLFEHKEEAKPDVPEIKN